MPVAATCKGVWPSLSCSSLAAFQERSHSAALRFPDDRAWKSRVFPVLDCFASLLAPRSYNREATVPRFSCIAGNSFLIHSIHVDMRFVKEKPRCLCTALSRCLMQKC
ncbi:hypothetical protein BDV06DRAFT_189025 [Aspergillus oleicola]